MIVLKFGGSSVANATAMSRVLDIVEQAAEKDRVILVSSAISGCTDALIQIGKAEDPEQLIDALERKHLAIINRLFTGKERLDAVSDCRSTFSEVRCIPPVIESFGELLSTRILSRKLSCEGFKATWIDSRNMIFTSGGEVDTEKSYAAIVRTIYSYPETRIFVAPGFIARDENENVTTLGRGGSDYSASLFAAATDADDLEIWTDVPGITVASLDDEQSGTTRVCLIGEGPVGAKAAVRRIETALREAGIKPLGEVQCEDGTNFCISVRSNVARNTVAAVHREFFEERALTTLDVYVAGHGAVGSALKDIVDACGGRFPSAGKRINIKEISSSHDFADRVLETARSRSIFVDCTDSTEIWRKFIPMFNKGISVVTSNRRSLAIPYVDYAAIKAAAAENGCFFRYDTTVGNALPILQSISDGANCGDGVTLIEAVVSCTLNYIITGYDGVRRESFATLLRKAQADGLTEQDPRIDLGGRDALRKLLILSREAGVPLEEKDVEIVPMLGPEYFKGSIEDFYRRLDEDEAKFVQREDELDAMGSRQRFVASLRRRDDGTFKAEIKMRLVGIDSPFYWISGTENVTIIHSGEAYPLVIKGSGEGARLAASGIIRNILQ